MATVEEFVKNGVYEINKSDCNPFDNITLEQTDRKPEEVDTFGGEMKSLSTLRMILMTVKLRQ